MRVLSWNSKEANPRLHKLSNQLSKKAQTYPTQVQLIWSIFQGQWKWLASREWQSVLPVEVAKGNLFRVFKRNKAHTQKKTPILPSTSEWTHWLELWLRSSSWMSSKLTHPHQALRFGKKLIPMAVKRRGIYSDLPWPRLNSHSKGTATAIKNFTLYTEKAHKQSVNSRSSGSESLFPGCPTDCYCLKYGIKGRFIFYFRLISLFPCLLWGLTKEWRDL